MSQPTHNIAKGKQHASGFAESAENERSRLQLGHYRGFNPIKSLRKEDVSSYGPRYTKALVAQGYGASDIARLFGISLEEAQKWMDAKLY